MEQGLIEDAKLVGRAAPGCGEAEARLARGVREIFGDQARAAWLSGSFVYDGARPCESDIDVVVLFAAPAPVPADGGTMARIRRFVDLYLEVHAQAGLDPDLEFPGEYVAPETLAETFAWRGLAHEGAVAERFPPVRNSDYWLGRPDRWFNAWLSMTAFSRFLAGDPAAHEAAKLEAWTTIARFLLLRGGGRTGEEALWERLGQFGVKPRYQALRRLEAPWLERALARLVSEGAVRREGEALVPQRDALAAWEREMAAAIARGGGGDGGGGPLVLTPPLHREIEEHARRRWAERERG